MFVPKLLQTYVSWSQIFGDYGNPWEVGLARTGTL
jgi:hypothetical protein